MVHPDPLLPLSHAPIHLQSWADNCVFAHSSMYFGENIGLGDPMAALNVFYGEVCNYDFNSPGWSPFTGHFTQTVWRATTQIGCALGRCPQGTRDQTGRLYMTGPFVCLYNPPGNGGGPGTYRDMVPPLRAGAPNLCRGNGKK